MVGADLRRVNMTTRRTFVKSAACGLSGGIAGLFGVGCASAPMAGSSIAVIRHHDRRIVLAGDECYVRACLDKKIPTGASFNPEKSEEFIRTYSGGGYEVHLYHDFSTLPNRNGALKVI